MSAIPHFISDLHLGHKNILRFAGEFRRGLTVEEHDEWIIEQWNAKVKKRDIVYILGDVAFSTDGLEKVKRLNGIKRCVPGNHDVRFLKYFESVGIKVMPGIVKYKDFWLTHCPIHPLELRGCINVHGHVHHRSIPDPRYFNVCVEALGGIPISLDELREKTKGVKGMKQSRLSALVEAIINVLIGSGVSIAAQYLIFPLYNIEVSLGVHFEIMLWFTGISIARSYIIRRWFDKRIHKLASKIS